MDKDQMSKNNKSFTDFLIIILKRRKLIITNVVTVTIIATIISFLIPKWYTSKANLLPPSSSGGLLGELSNFSSTIQNISKSFGRLGTVSDEAYNYLAILQSRTTAEKVINKFNLREVYEFDEDEPIENIIKELNSNVDFNIEDEGNVTIEVTDEDPQLAADMAAYYVKVLNEISRDLGTLEAKNNREFIERRYIQAMADISSVEDSLKKFAEKHSVFDIEEQTKAAITAAAELKAQIEVAKIERDLLLMNYGKDNPYVINKEVLISELKRRLDNMKFAEISNSNNALYTPFSELPEVGVNFIRLQREYELQAKILEFIVPIYEQAKIEETKDIPATLVLDYPVPAQKKAGPKKAIIVGAAFLLSLFFSIMAALMLESLERLRQDEMNYSRVNEGIFNPLRRMLFLKRR